MNKGCKNCKYHKIDEVVFANSQSICVKNNKIIEGWFGCGDYEFYLTKKEKQIIQEALFTYVTYLDRQKHHLKISEIVVDERLKEVNELLDKLGE